MPSSGNFVTMYLVELHFGNGYMEIGLLISSLHGVSNGMTATESLKMLQKCFGESILRRTQLFERHEAFCDDREVVQNLPHASRPSTSFNDDNLE